jgi:hypothetical protein
MNYVPFVGSTEASHGRVPRVGSDRPRHEQARN